jgi:phage tail P2-like protein
MVKNLNDARITDGLPRIVSGQDWVIALSDALGTMHEQTMQFADESQIYTAIDSAKEEILDALAVNWKVEWYKEDYEVEKKREIIKNALTVRRLMGTAYAVRTQADIIFPGTKIEEWFEYGGEPGTYRTYVDISESSEENPVQNYSMEELERQLSWVKRWSIHVDSASFMIRKKIAVKHEIGRWAYNVPECGTLYCGTYWENATLGYSTEDTVMARSGLEAISYKITESGTVPEISTKGYGASETFEYGGTVEGFITETARCGGTYCGQTK